MRTSLIKNPRAGDFAAVCRQPRWVPLEELGDVDPATVQSRWDKKLTCNVYLVQCALETKDPAELEAHMADMHGGGIYRWDNSSLSDNVTQVRNYTPRVAAVKSWKPPTLKAEGATFEPKDLQPGAEVTWPTGSSSERSGQVWSAGPFAKSAWVIPDEPIVEHHPQKDLVRFERALLVKLDHRGEIYACADTT